jgi:hypothetical protein
LVSSRRKHYNESMSTGSRDYSKWYTPMETTSNGEYHQRNSICVKQ